MRKTSKNVKLTRQRIPICTVCGKKMVLISHLEIMGMRISNTYGHKECNTMYGVPIKGMEKYIPGVLVC